MILMLIPIIFTGVTGYFIYDKIISSKLDTPQNNPSVKGLEKAEIREAIKENETKVKQLKEEIKKIEKERKDILEGSDDDKADQAKAKLEEKTDRIKELEQTEQDLSDLKTVENGEWKAMLPNKLSWNNAFWIGGFLLALYLFYKFFVVVFRSLLNSIGFNE